MYLQCLFSSVFMLVAIYKVQSITDNIDVKKVKCLVCNSVIKEMQNNVSKVDSKKTISIRGSRLDSEGNFNEKFIPYVKSEIFLMELMDNICERMDDYVQATFKKNGELAVLPLVLEGGKMNPEISEVDIVKDSELNKSLKSYCHTIVEENEEDIVDQFLQSDGKFDFNMCTYVLKICKDNHEEL